MRCGWWFLFGVLWWLPVLSSTYPSIAFYYGQHAPVDELHSFDIAVVDPNSGLDPKKYDDGVSSAYAYVSVGEWPSDRPVKNPAWLKAKNTAWHSRVIDQTAKGWPDYFFNQLIAPLWQQGYRGFFLDTLDSYQLFAKTDKERAAQTQALSALILHLKEKYPDAHILINRGFELLPKVASVIEGVAAESLYAGWDQAKKKYRPVPAADRAWLKTKMQAVKARGLWPIVIDYAATADQKRAQQAVDAILADGFIPWVGNGQLTNLGRGAWQVVPRRVYMIYDSQQFPEKLFSDAQRFAAFPLEQMGYVPELVDVRGPLPEFPLKGRVAGILVWINGVLGKREKYFSSWLAKQNQQGIPLLLLGRMSYLDANVALEKRLGIHLQATFGVAPFTIVKKTALMGYEGPVRPAGANVEWAAKSVDAQLVIKDKTGQQSPVVAFAPWGGYAQDPFVVRELSAQKNYWVLDPFRFFRRSLHLPYLPVPDLTTQNGLRMLMVHIDGDGFMSKAQWFKGPYAGQALLNRVLMKYRIPTTMSVIEGEIGPEGVYPNKAPALMAIARDIYKLPWVEAATHTYSHPFKWQLLAQQKAGVDYNLPIKGYRYSPEREITGSCQFINRYLVPKGKHCKMVLWSGDTNPDEAALKVAYEDGLLNMNGGDTLITARNKSLTAIAPIGILKGSYLQVFAPNQNENVYTNGWTGPFYGFRRVISTFKLTEAPHRYKPIDIYYHTYSASKLAALKALYQVYDWALAQNTNKVFSSAYVKKAMDYYHIAIAKQAQTWRMSGMQHLREFRIPKRWGQPKLEGGDWLGFNQYDEQYYLHARLGTPRLQLQMTQKKTNAPYIIWANGVVKKFKRIAQGLQFTLQAYENLQWSMANMQHCQLFIGDSLLKPLSQHGAVKRYQLDQREADAVTARCQA